MKVTAIFDIGKTNKKCFLFDESYNEVFKFYNRFEEIKDEDGDPCDNLTEICAWIDDTLTKILSNNEYEVTSINFSTYGASFVHIDENGNVLSPLYNYLKPYPQDLLNQFYDQYGDQISIAQETSSPQLGMLNSGMQLYWLKYRKPEIFKKIKYALHFPQYLSYRFSNIPISDFTSIGCHTNLWDYSKQDYHRWVYAEGIDKILAPVDLARAWNIVYQGKEIQQVGRGIHDSSAALLPYSRSSKENFLLLSTGTWSICLNPFNNKLLTNSELQKDCLNFLSSEGKPVRASRLFLGNEYNLQIKKLSEYFHVEEQYFKTIAFDEGIYNALSKKNKRHFVFESIKGIEEKHRIDLDSFTIIEEAYHQLMLELMDLQVRSAALAIGDTTIKKIYIDGGFADNDIYVQLLVRLFPNMKVSTTTSPLGSALGAAIALSDQELHHDFLKDHFSLIKHDRQELEKQDGTKI